MPRFGRIYANAVLRPLAEQLLNAEDIQAGETLFTFFSDTEVLVDQAKTLVGKAGVAISIETPELLHALGDHQGDRALGLFPERLDEKSVAELQRVIKPDGSIAVMTFAQDGPLYERILLDALQETTGAVPGYASTLFGHPTPVANWQEMSIHEVVRFDGVHQYWDALLSHRGLLDNPDIDLAAVRRLVNDALQEYEAADGTLRIPYEAVIHQVKTKAAAPDVGD